MMQISQPLSQDRQTVIDSLLLVSSEIFGRNDARRH